MSDRGTITVYGAATCEDTAITRSRLDALGVAYRYVDIDGDPDGAAEVVRLNGRRVTPTVVRDAPKAIAKDVAEHMAEHIAEPPIERLDALARAARAPFDAPGGEQLHGPLVASALPFRTLEAAGGGTFSLASLRGRRAAAVLFAHRASCLACFGYAKQLGRQGPALGEADAEPIIVVRGGVAEAAAWSHELPARTRLVADPDGAWRSAVAGALGREGEDVLLVLVDRFAAPRVVSTAPDAGGLMSPAEATSWLRFVALDCPECSGEIAWPD